MPASTTVLPETLNLHTEPYQFPQVEDFLGRTVDSLGLLDDIAENFAFDPTLRPKPPTPPGRNRIERLPAETHRQFDASLCGLSERELARIERATARINRRDERQQERTRRLQEEERLRHEARARGIGSAAAAHTVHANSHTLPLLRLL